MRYRKSMDNKQRERERIRQRVYRECSVYQWIGKDQGVAVVCVQRPLQQGGDGEGLLVHVLCVHHDAWEGRRDAEQTFEGRGRGFAPHKFRTVLSLHDQKSFLNFQVWDGQTNEANRNFCRWKTKTYNDHFFGLQNNKTIWSFLGPPKK